MMTVEPRRGVTPYQAREGAPVFLSDMIMELGFVVNCHIALRLVKELGARVSVELHPDVAEDIDRTVYYAERYYAVTARTFADARPGDIILYEDSYRNVSVAISGGNAASMFGISEGRDLRIHLEPA